MDECSLEAYASISLVINELQQLVLNTLIKLGGEATHEELEEELPHLCGSTVRTRVRELVDKGLAMKTGKKKININGLPVNIWGVK